MDLIEGSETSANINQTLGIHPKIETVNTEHSESLKSRIINHVPTAYNVAAVLYLRSVLHVMLFPLLNMLCTFTLALSVVCVLCPIWRFFFLCFTPGKDPVPTV
jgi:hypothetical protein